MTDFSPEVILVTGGAGFIGCNFVHHLLATHDDIRVVTLDKLTYAGSRANLSGLPDPGRHVFVPGDINNRDLVEKLMRAHGIDSVVHLAAESHVDRSISAPRKFISSNIDGTFALLEVARRCWEGRDPTECRFVHVSTDEVYGSLDAQGEPFCETTPYAPNSPYSASKAASDHLVRAWHRTYGLPVVTTHCSNNYGPHQHAEKLIPTVIRSCLRNTKMPVYGDGSNIRDWIYVGDCCAALDAALRRGRTGESYNIGGFSQWANIDLVRLICAVMDEKRPIQEPYETLIDFVPDRPGHDWRYATNPDKTVSGLRWEPVETLQSGIRKTVDWYLANESWALTGA